MPHKVSIHLMFLLIEYKRVQTDARDSRFNTSHVSINLNAPSVLSFSFQRFNTSHVSINLNLEQLSLQRWRVSIHLMFLLISWQG